MQANSTLYAKLRINNRLNTYRICFTFDKHNTITVRNCILETGDIVSVKHEDAMLFVNAALQKAKVEFNAQDVVML